MKLNDFKISDEILEKLIVRYDQIFHKINRSVGKRIRILSLDNTPDGKEIEGILMDYDITIKGDLLGLNLILDENGKEVYKTIPPMIDATYIGDIFSIKGIYLKYEYKTEECDPQSIFIEFDKSSETLNLLNSKFIVPHFVAKHKELITEQSRETVKNMSSKGRKYN